MVVADLIHFKLVCTKVEGTIVVTLMPVSSVIVGMGHTLNFYNKAFLM